MDSKEELAFEILADQAQTEQAYQRYHEETRKLCRMLAFPDASQTVTPYSSTRPQFGHVFGGSGCQNFGPTFRHRGRCIT